MARPTRIADLLENARQSLGAGRYREVEKALGEVRLRDPRNAEAYRLSGLVQLARGRLSAAVEDFRRAVEAADGAVARLDLALALRTSGASEEALEQARRAVAVAPDSVPALLLLAEIERDADNFEAATEHYLAALAQAPASPQILTGLGEVHRRAGDLAAALAHLERAVAIAPNHGEAWEELGGMALASGDAEQAIEALRNALLRLPERGRIVAKLCDAYAARDAGAAATGAVTALSPQSLGELYVVVAALQEGGFIATAISAFEAIARRNPDAIRAQSQLVFLANYGETGDPMRITARARRVGALLPRTGGPSPWWPAGGDPERRLRVGLVSDDLRDHVVRFFLLSFLEHVDQSQIELVAYSSAPTPDAITACYQSIIGTWCDAATMSDAELAHRIAADRIDILIDLGGHTQRTRLGVFALRPAPVQATWLGYSGTTGVAEIDFILGDRLVTPPGEEPQLTETPWPLPDSYLCYQPRDVDVPVAPPPALAARRLTFGSFNLLPKLSDASVALWAKVIEAVPRSRLLLKSRALDDARHAAATRARFARHGIDGDQLILAGQVHDPAEHLASYNRIDIALDPFPYNGTTTTAEALWMGVPVLTLRGDRFIAHVGESMLAAAGHPEWIADDTDGFVRLAASVASDLKHLARVRQSLRIELLGSPLCDGVRFARSFEAALRGMWRWHCEAGRPSD